MATVTSTHAATKLARRTTNHGDVHLCAVRPDHGNLRHAATPPRTTTTATTCACGGVRDSDSGAHSRGHSGYEAPRREGRGHEGAHA